MSADALPVVIPGTVRDIERQRLATQAYVRQLDAATRAAREYEESSTRATEAVRALQARLDEFSGALEAVMAMYPGLGGMLPDAPGPGARMDSGAAR